MNATASLPRVILVIAGILAVAIGGTFAIVHCTPAGCLPANAAERWFAAALLLLAGAGGLFMAASTFILAALLRPKSLHREMPVGGQ